MFIFQINFGQTAELINCPSIINWTLIRFLPSRVPLIQWTMTTHCTSSIGAVNMVQVGLSSWTILRILHLEMLILKLLAGLSIRKVVSFHWRQTYW